MSSRTRTLLLAGCFFLVGLFAPLPPLQLGLSSPRPARDSATRVAAGIAPPAAVLGELAPAVLGGQGTRLR